MSSAASVNETVERCFCCGRPLRSTEPHQVWTSDPQMQHVGPECHRLIAASGAAGYQPPLGGPRLYASPATATQLNQEQQP